MTKVEYVLRAIFMCSVWRARVGLPKVRLLQFQTKLVNMARNVD